MVTGVRKFFCWAGPLEPVARLEVCSRRLFRLPLLVHALRAVHGRDVAEATFLSTRHSGRRLVGRQSADSMFLNQRQGGTYIGGAEKIGLCAAD